MVLDRSCKPEVVPCLWLQGGPMMVAGDSDTSLRRPGAQADEQRINED